MTDLLFLIGDIIMWAALVGAIVFGISYATFFNWRKTAPGRSLMYLDWAIIAWGTQTALARSNPDYYLREWVRIVVYLAIAYTIWRLVVTLWRSWKRTPYIKIEPRKKDEYAE